MGNKTVLGLKLAVVYKSYLGLKWWRFKEKRRLWRLSEHLKAQILISETEK